jgi:hypothetical protein
LSRIVISTTKSCILYAAANVRGRNRAATLSTASALDDTSDRTNGPLAADWSRHPSASLAMIKVFGIYHPTDPEFAHLQAETGHVWGKELPQAPVCRVAGGGLTLRLPQIRA